MDSALVEAAGIEPASLRMKTMTNQTPATVQDALTARLDRLATVKETAQIGAAIGREFSHELMAAVTPLRDNELQDALEEKRADHGADDPRTIRGLIELAALQRRRGALDEALRLADLAQESIAKLDQSELLSAELEQLIIVSSGG